MTGEIKQFKKYVATNRSFEEIFAGEYSLPLKEAPATVLDIGANEGAFTAWALEQWPDCRVTAYEPVPDNAGIFRKNINGDGRVTFHELAVANDPVITLRLGLHNSGEASRYDLGAQNGKKIEVNTMAPFKLPCAEYVKLDTEGCEVEILEGLDLSKTKALVCEYHWSGHEQKIRDLCGRAGLSSYSHKKMYDDRGILKFVRSDAVKSGTKLPTRVFIGVAAHFAIDPNFHQCMLPLVAMLARDGMRGGIHGEICHAIGDNAHVGRARNLLTRKFLEQDFTDILFIDSDIVFSPDHVRRILEHQEPIVGGLYFKKMDGEPKLCINPKDKAVVRNDGLVEVRYIGTGFLRIKREVFERMIEKFGDEMAYTPDSHANDDVLEYNFWNLQTYTWPKEQCKIDPNQVKYFMEKYKISEERASKAIRTRWLSEDWWFCQRAMDLGYTIWADQHIALRHSGNILYPLRTQEDEALGRRKAADLPVPAAVPQPALASA